MEEKEELAHAPEKMLMVVALVPVEVAEQSLCRKIIGSVMHYYVVLGVTV